MCVCVCVCVCVCACACVRVCVCVCGQSSPHVTGRAGANQLWLALHLSKWAYKHLTVTCSNCTVYVCVFSGVRKM